jgi:hypothetical protein
LTVPLLHAALLHAALAPVPVDGLLAPAGLLAWR